MLEQFEFTIYGVFSISQASCMSRDSPNPLAFALVASVDERGRYDNDTVAMVTD